jgi:hypothetical protein
MALVAEPAPPQDVGSSDYRGLYFGTGLKNEDVYFML